MNSVFFQPSFGTMSLNSEQNGRLGKGDQQSGIFDTIKNWPNLLNNVTELRSILDLPLAQYVISICDQMAADPLIVRRLGIDC